MRAPSACRPRAGIAWSVRCCSTGVKGARGGGRVVGACVRERRGVTAVLRYLARYLCGGRDQARTRERVGNNSSRRASGTTLDPPGRALEPRAALGRRGLGTELGYGGPDYARGRSTSVSRARPGPRLPALGLRTLAARGQPPWWRARLHGRKTPTMPHQCSGTQSSGALLII